MSSPATPVLFLKEENGKQLVQTKEFNETWEHERVIRDPQEAVCLCTKLPLFHHSFYGNSRHTMYTQLHTQTHSCSLWFTKVVKQRETPSPVAAPAGRTPIICLPAQNGQTQLSIKQLTYLLSDATAALQVDTDGQQFGFTDNVISKTHKCGKVALRDILTSRSSC